MNIQSYDLFMLVVLGAAIAWGAWKGLAWQIASIASLVVSYIVSLNFRQPLSQLITATPPWNVFLAMLILFLGTSLVVWVGFNFISELIEKVRLQAFDRQVGAMLGFAKGVILCVLITLFSVTLLSEPQRQAICNSQSGHYIALLLDRADGIMPTEVHQVLDPYIREFDNRVDHPHDGPLLAPLQPNGPTWQPPTFNNNAGMAGNNGSNPAATVDWGKTIEQARQVLPYVRQGIIDAQPAPQQTPPGSARQNPNFSQPY